MTEHTPGPWKIVHYAWNDKGKDGDFVGRIDGPNGEKVYGGAASFHAINNLANAHLIAAAPDLLGALKELAMLHKEMLSLVDESGFLATSVNRLVIKDKLEKAHTAIAKATGQGAAR